MSLLLSTSPSSRTSMQTTIASRLSAVHLDRRTPTPSNSSRRRQNSHLASSLFQTPLVMLESRTKEDTARNSEVFRYEWPIYGLAQLRHHVEDCPGGVWSLEMEMEDPESLPESLRSGKIIGPGWFKLDLARTIPHPHSPKTPVEDIVTTLATENKCIDTLSLYIAALSLDSGPTEIRYPASLFVGIRPIYNHADWPAGSSYYWTTSTEWEFTPHNEFWEVQLPKMSHLLSDPRLRDQDGFTLCIEIATPEAIGPAFSRPDKIEVDSALINGLRSLVDSTTGDVAFMCLEHDCPCTPTSEGDEEVAEETARPLTVSRKRVIYAHSEILKSASDFFHALLTGEFEEAGRARRGEARHTPIMVDDADFKAVYWVLRYIYTKEISFAEVEDVRTVMDQLQIEPTEIIRALSDSSKLFGSAEWDYRRVLRQGEEPEDLEEMDVRTVISASSMSTRRSAISPTPSTRANDAKSNTSRTGTSKTGTIAATPTKTASLAQDPSSRGRNGKGLAASPTTKTTAVAAPKPSKTSPAPINRPTYTPRAPDPHPHPCAPPGPASALSVFMLSHRYGLDKLESLSKAHILEGLTPENCMPMLLASYRYETLHSDVFDFILSHWDAVQNSEELAKCVDEVSAGVWGETGGRVILGLFRRL